MSDYTRQMLLYQTPPQLRLRVDELLGRPGDPELEDVYLVGTVPASPRQVFDKLRRADPLVGELMQEYIDMHDKRIIEQVMLANGDYIDGVTGPPYPTSHVEVPSEGEGVPDAHGSRCEPPHPEIIEQATRPVGAHPAHECPRCATPGTYLYQGGGHWYCGVCDHDGWDEEETLNA